MVSDWYFRHEKKLLGVATVIAFLTIWELAAALQLVNPLFLSSPSRVWIAMAALAETGELWTHLRVSGEEFFWGYLIAAVIGVPIGICLG